MKILNNAVESIQIGLEDFKNPDPRRAQSALRNIFAGILLLFKEKLRRLSPAESQEVLIKQSIVPKLDEKQHLIFIGMGKKTVDVHQIKQRFKEFKISVDWEKFEEINKLRNEIEHYYTEKSPRIINEIVSKSFKIINEFCIINLNEDPIDLIGQESWNIFLEVDEIYTIEKDKSVESLSKINWKFSILIKASENIRCPNCGSELIFNKNVIEYQPSELFPLTCKECCEDFDLEIIIEEIVSEELAGESHIAATDGAKEPYTDCPECDKSCYVYSEECCVACGFQQKNKFCTICGNNLDLEEAYEGELCAYHRHIMEKND